jgi:pyruvate-ferredoxin/flavodoxin oxidoreductase
VAHWCATETVSESLKKIKPEQAAKLISLDNMLGASRQDVVSGGIWWPITASACRTWGSTLRSGRQRRDRNGHCRVVLFCVERRKAWRMLKSKADVENRD